DPRSGPRLCEAQRFMVPMRDCEVVEALHEPGGARLRRALTDSCGWEIRARWNLAPPFMVQMRGCKTVETFHEPGGTSNTEHRMAARVLAHFGVRCSMLDARCFHPVQEVQGANFRFGKISLHSPFEERASSTRGSHRPLPLEEPAFALDTRPITAETAVGSDHAVARDDH